jgi:hypothetical protein
MNTSQTPNRGMAKSFTSTRFCSVLCLAVIFLVTGCLSRPIEPDDLEIVHATAGSPLNQQALDTFRSILGSPLPHTFVMDEQVTGWRDHQGNLKQIRAHAEVSDEDFSASFRAKEWRKVKATDNELEAMHLSRGAADEFLCCYLGKMNGKPVYMMRFEGLKTVMLIVDI